MNTPLLSHLSELSKRQNMHRFHMPGHKGVALSSCFDSAFAIDYTEIPQTGNLYGVGGIIQSAEELAARYFGADSCFFLTCGATQGIKAAISAFCGVGGKLLIDRNCHKSVIDVCALLDIDAHFIRPELLEGFGISGEIDAEEFEAALLKSGASAAILTSPTYYGYLLQTDELCNIAHKHGVKIIIDGAHGSHLKACGVKTHAFQAADAVIFSAHKTLMALTQGAYLLVNNASGALLKKIRSATSMFGTTSPSYVIMASLDFARAYAEENSELYLNAAEAALSLRARLAEDTAFLVFDGGDPLRLTISALPLGISGFECAELFGRLGIEPEMCDDANVVFIITPADLSCGISALLAVAIQISNGHTGCVARVATISIPHHLRKMSVRDACRMETTEVMLSECNGKISAQCIAPYPPGVAVITPGELIYENSIEYLLKKGYNGSTLINIVSYEKEEV